MNQIPQNSISPQNPITPPPPSPQPYVSPTTSPLPPASQPIPIQRELTPQQEEELCRSFHEHSVRCTPLEIVRGIATYFNPNWNDDSE